MSNSLLVLCPCGIPFAVPDKWLRDHPSGIWECKGMKTVDGKHVICGRKYPTVRMEKEFWRGEWNPEEQITE